MLHLKLVESHLFSFSFNVRLVSSTGSPPNFQVQNPTRGLGPLQIWKHITNHANTCMTSSCCTMLTFHNSSRRILWQRIFWVSVIRGFKQEASKENSSEHRDLPPFQDWFRFTTHWKRNQGGKNGRRRRRSLPQEPISPVRMEMHKGCREGWDRVE